MALLGIPSKKEREFEKQQIENCKRIFTDSMKIMMHTDNIDTFMSRKKVLRDALYEAGRVAGENKKCINGISPKMALEIFDRDLSLILDPCIERYMRKQTIRISNLSRDRVKKANGIRLIISTYEEDLPKESMDYWNRLVDKLVEKIQALEATESNWIVP
jgi:hypothetical protein